MERAQKQALSRRFQNDDVCPFFENQGRIFYGGYGRCRNLGSELIICQGDIARCDVPAVIERLTNPPRPGVSDPLTLQQS